MGIMDYIPQFGGAVGQQDVSGLPADDTMMQLELKRRLDLAKSLQNQEMPQGQMVSGRYVAPSWTQYLANAVDKYQGLKQEKEAMKQFGEYQTAKQKKLADLLQGKEVIAPIDYTEAGNMPGMTQTTRQPYSQQEFLSKAVGVMPELAPKLIESQVSQYNKEEQPISLGEGGVLVNRKGEVIAQNPKAGKNGEWKEAGGVLYQIGADGKPTGVTLGQAKQKEPKFETFREGTNQVTYQINPDGTRTKVASGPAFAPQKPEPDPWHLNTPNIATKNAKGWTLHTDKNGNMAYVSPDGKSFEEVK